MNSRSIRSLTQTAILAAAGAAALPATSARAVDKWWNAAGGSWNTAGNWFAPGAPLSTDNVFIGNTALAENATVQLNVDATVASLIMTDGMTLRTNTSRLIVTGTTLISGSNSLPDDFLYRSRVMVLQSPFPVDFQSGPITITDGGTLRIEDGATAQASGQVRLDDGSAIQGDGVLRLTSNTSPALIVNGNIFPEPGASPLTIQQLGTGLIDLDGSVADGPNREINVTGSMNNFSTFADLTINGTELTDAFDDSMSIGPGNTVNMNLTNGWTMGPGGELRMNSWQGHNPTLDGGRLDLRGRLRVQVPDSNPIIHAPMTFATSSNTSLSENSRITCYASVTFEGGSMTLAPGSLLALNGPVEWKGQVDVVGEGAIFVQTSSWVSGPTVINAQTFDFDGSGISDWIIQAPLTINSAVVDPMPHPDDFNVIDGVVSITGPLDARLTINLTTPGSVWTMGGTLNLSAPLGNATTRLAGTTVAIDGPLNISGAVRSQAPYGLFTDSVTTFANASARFENSSSAMVFAGAQFLGGGTLTCAASGSMRLADGASLGSSRLENQGDLEINFGVGQANVGGFSQTATGTYHVDLGGYEPGTKHDHLVVTIHPATLGGMVQVDLVDAGDGAFSPQIGDAFTVLTSRNGLIGSFAGVSPTIRNGVLYTWTLEQDGTAVRVRLASIDVRCDADWNCDGFLDFFDYDDYVNTFEGGTPPDCRSDADFNGDGFVDFFDYDDFVAFFESGC